jgi:hypothetical protein
MIIDEKTKESAAGAPPEYSLAAAGQSGISSFTETASPSQLSPSIDAAGPSRSGSFTDADARTMLDLPPPYEAVLGPLSLPFVLPQESVGLDYAFARGYNPALAASGVSLADWLRFVDALNLATVRHEDTCHFPANAHVACDRRAARRATCLGWSAPPSAPRIHSSISSVG